MVDRSAEETILDRERRALDRWAAGDPAGYFARCAEDVTYFDDIGAQRGVQGLAAVREYAAALDGRIPPHRYELVEPRVQVYGDVGVVSLRYEPRTDEGTALTPWRASVVYRRTGGDWRVVHAHWAMMKEW